MNSEQDISPESPGPHSKLHPEEVAEYICKVDSFTLEQVQLLYIGAHLLQDSCGVPLLSLVELLQGSLAQLQWMDRHKGVVLEMILEVFEPLKDYN